MEFFFNLTSRFRLYLPSCSESIQTADIVDFNQNNNNRLETKLLEKWLSKQGSFGMGHITKYTYFKL